MLLVRAAWRRSTPTRQPPPPRRPAPSRARATTATRAARASCRSASRRPGCSRSRTSPSRRTCSTRRSYGAISLLWSVLFVVISVIYRPVEQLLSRTIAERRARGLHHSHPLRIPLLLQAASRCSSSRWPWRCAARSRTPSTRPRCTGSSSAATAAYAASYFARGYFAGHQWFGLYGGLVLFESLSRFAFPRRGRGRAGERADRGGAGHRRGAAGVAAGDPVGDHAPRRSRRRRAGGGRPRGADDARGRRLRARRSPRSSSPSSRCSTPRC